ncbi:unnamed protein product [Amoebophrya sp. A25]|nr:unnamed protein product [Amoebophrya sp. A25]|eukprot:GSA25T00013684001.1
MTLCSLFYRAAVKSVAAPLLLACVWAVTVSGTTSSAAALLCVGWALVARAFLLQTRPEFHCSSVLLWVERISWKQVVIAFGSVVIFACIDDDALVSASFWVYPSTVTGFYSASSYGATGAASKVKHPGSFSSSSKSGSVNSVLLDPASNFAYFAFPVAKGDQSSEAEHEAALPLSEADRRLAALANPSLSRPATDTAATKGATPALSNTAEARRTSYLGHHTTSLIDLFFRFLSPTFFLAVLCSMNIFLWAAGLHLLFRFVGNQQYVLKFGTKPAFFSRLRRELPDILVSCAKLAITAGLLARDGWRIPAVFCLLFVFEVEAIALHESGDIARNVVGFIPTIQLQERLAQSLSYPTGSLEVELSFVFVAQISRCGRREWTETLFRERGILSQFFVHAGAAAEAGARRAIDSDYVGFFENECALRFGIRALGDWVALSKRLDGRGGLVLLAEPIAALAVLCDAVTPAVQQFPVGTASTLRLYSGKNNKALENGDHGRSGGNFVGGGGVEQSTRPGAPQPASLSFVGSLHALTERIRLTLFRPQNYASNYSEPARLVSDSRGSYMQKSTVSPDFPAPNEARGNAYISSEAEHTAILVSSESTAGAEILQAMERIIAEAHLSLTQWIELFGEVTIRDHWPRKHGRLLSVLLGETEHPMSMFNLQRDAGRSAVVSATLVGGSRGCLAGGNFLSGSSSSSSGVKRGPSIAASSSSAALGAPRTGVSRGRNVKYTNSVQPGIAGSGGRGSLFGASYSHANAATPFDTGRSQRRVNQGTTTGSTVGHQSPQRIRTNDKHTPSASFIGPGNDPDRSASASARGAAFSGSKYFLFGQSSSSPDESATGPSFGHAAATHAPPGTRKPSGFRQRVKQASFF